jgi:hypothetical protein
MTYKVLAACSFAGKAREVGDIIPSSEAIKDTFFNYYMNNGSLEAVVEPELPKKQIKK